MFNILYNLPSTLSHTFRRSPPEIKADEKPPSAWVQDKIKQSGQISETNNANLVEKVKGKLKKIDPRLIGESRFHPSYFILFKLVVDCAYIYRAYANSNNVSKWQSRFHYLENVINSYWNAVDRNDQPKAQALLLEFPFPDVMESEREKAGQRLHLAFDREQYKLLNQYLESPGAKSFLMYQDAEGNTLLHKAIKKNLISLSKKIADTNPKLLEIENLKNETPCFLAYFLNKKLTYYLISSSMEIDWQKALVDSSLLYQICRQKDREMLYFLDQHFPFIISSPVYSQIGTIFDLICTYGDVQTAQWLLGFQQIKNDLSKRIRTKCADSENPLLNAVFGKEIKVIELIINSYPEFLNIRASPSHSYGIFLFACGCAIRTTKADEREKLLKIIQFLANSKSFNPAAEYPDIINPPFVDAVEKYVPLAEFLLQTFPQLVYEPSLSLFSAFVNYNLILSKLLLQVAPQQLVTLNSAHANPLIYLYKEMAADNRTETFFYMLANLPEFQQAVRTVRCQQTGNTILHQLVVFRGAGKLIDYILSLISPELITIKNNKSQLPCHRFVKHSTKEELKDKTYILRFKSLFPSFSELKDQRDAMGFYPVHYMTRRMEPSILEEICLDPQMTDRLVFEKRTDFISFARDFVISRTLEIFKGVDSKLPMFSDKCEHAHRFDLWLNMSLVEGYFNLINEFSHLLDQFSGVILDPNMIERRVKIFSIWIAYHRNFERSISEWLSKNEIQLETNIESNDEEATQSLLATFRGIRLKLIELKRFLNELNEELNKPDRSQNVIEIFKGIGLPFPKEALENARKTAQALSQRMDQLVESGQSKRAKTKREIISLEKLLHDEDDMDIYQILDYLCSLENLKVYDSRTKTDVRMPFEEAFLKVFGITKADNYKLKFYEFGIQEAKDLRPLGISFEVKILNATNRALSSPDQFLAVLSQKSEILQQLPETVKAKLKEDLKQKGFKTLEEELKLLSEKSLTLETIDHLRKHEIAMNTSLFSTFINQDLLELLGYIKDLQKLPEAKNRSLTLVDLHEKHQFSTSDMYQLADAIKRKKSEKKE